MDLWNFWFPDVHHDAYADNDSVHGVAGDSGRLHFTGTDDLTDWPLYYGGVDLRTVPSDAPSTEGRRVFLSSPVPIAKRLVIGPAGEILVTAQATLMDNGGLAVAADSEADFGVTPGRAHVFHVGVKIWKQADSGEVSSSVEGGVWQSEGTDSHSYLSTATDGTALFVASSDAGALRVGVLSLAPFSRVPIDLSGSGFAEVTLSRDSDGWHQHSVGLISGADAVSLLYSGAISTGGEGLIAGTLDSTGILAERSMVLTDATYWPSQAYRNATGEIVLPGVDSEGPHVKVFTSDPNLSVRHAVDLGGATTDVRMAKLTDGTLVFEGIVARTILCSTTLVALFACTGGGGKGGPPEVFRETDGSIAYDADNDGYADVGGYVPPDPNGPDQGMYVILYGGPEGLSDARRLEIPVSVPYGEARWIGDINDDGFADAAIFSNVANRSSNTVIVHGGPREVLPFTGGYRCAVDGVEDDRGSNPGWAGDLNGDGIDDLLFFGGRGRACAWAGGPERLGQDPDVSTPVEVLQQWSGVGDVDGDGYADINGLFKGGPDLFSTETLFVPEYGVYGSSDINGDGFVDLLGGVNSYAPSTFILYEGGPDGFDSSVSDRHDLRLEHTVVGYTAKLVHLGDVNGDGKDDVAFSSPFFPDGEYGPGTPGSAAILYGGQDGLRAGVDDPGQEFSPLHEFQPLTDTIELTSFVPGLVIAIGDINGDGYGDMGFGSTGGIGYMFGSAKGFESNQLDGFVGVNRSAVSMAATGPGAL